MDCGLRPRVNGLGPRVNGLGPRAWGLVWGLEFKISPVVWGEALRKGRKEQIDVVAWTLDHRPIPLLSIGSELCQEVNLRMTSEC